MHDSAVLSIIGSLRTRGIEITLDVNDEDSDDMNIGEEER